MDFNKFLSALEKAYYPQIKNLFGGDNSKASLWVQKVVTPIKNNPELLKCNTDSLFGSLMLFADLNLAFNTPEGYGYVVAVNGFATPIIGYKGLIEIAYRNKALKQIRMASVYQDDVFEFQYGTNEFIKHIPGKTKTGSPIAAYAIAQLEGLNPFFTVITAQDLQKIAEASFVWSNQNTLKIKDLDVNHVMQAKATIKQLFKTLPKGGNEKLIELMDVDNKLDFDKNTHMAIKDGRYKVASSRFSSLTSLPAPEIEVKKSENKIKEELKSNN
jgi:phage RecT family recombinase